MTLEWVCFPAFLRYFAPLPYFFGHDVDNLLMNRTLETGLTLPWDDTIYKLVWNLRLGGWQVCTWCQPAINPKSPVIRSHLVPQPWWGNSIVKGPREHLWLLGVFWGLFSQSHTGLPQCAPAVRAGIHHTLGTHHQCCEPCLTPAHC